MFWSFSLLFFFCEFGETISRKFYALRSVIWDCQWYSYPIEIQRMIQIILIGTQPVTLRGYGNILCTREVFKKVRELLNVE